MLRPGQVWNEKAGGAELDDEFEAFMNDMGGGAPKVAFLLPSCPHLFVKRIKRQFQFAPRYHLPLFTPTICHHVCRTIIIHPCVETKSGRRQALCATHGGPCLSTVRGRRLKAKGEYRVLASHLILWHLWFDAGWHELLDDERERTHIFSCCRGLAKVRWNSNRWGGEGYF